MQITEKVRFPLDLQTQKTRKNGRKNRIDLEEDTVESRARDFLAAEKIQAASCSLGEKNALLERFFDLRPDNFLDGQITGIGSLDIFIILYGYDHYSSFCDDG